MSFIQILEDPEFDWQFTDPDTQEKLESTFRLRTMPGTMHQSLIRKHTKGRNNRVDNVSLNADVLDYVILKWDGVKGVRHADGKLVKADLPCTKENKIRLPSKVKVAIIELTVGLAFEEEAEDDDKVPSKSL